MEAPPLRITRCGICMEDFDSFTVKELFETLLCGHQICNSCFSSLLEFNKHTCPYCRTPFFPIPIKPKRPSCFPVYEMNEEISDEIRDFLDSPRQRRNNPRNRRRRWNEHNQRHEPRNSIEGEISIASAPNPVPGSIFEPAFPSQSLPVIKTKKLPNNDKKAQKIKNNKNNSWNYLRNNLRNNFY